MNLYDDNHDIDTEQLDLFETKATQSLLDQLLTDSKLYHQSKDYKDLLDFVIRLRNFAPFNAMLLQLQKPGLSYAALARDWLARFDRKPKEGSRPLLILWPFGPVALVYDVMDTEGKPLPEDVATFFARGPVDENLVNSFISILRKKRIELYQVDEGDRKAGSIQLINRAPMPSDFSEYRININRNHSPAVQFATLAHELGHLFLGHLGPDKKLGIIDRKGMSHAQVELEAESVAYVVCARNGVKSKSERYLANYVSQHTTIDSLDLYQVMRAMGLIEALYREAVKTK